LGVPYGEAVTQAEPMAKAQAEAIARDIEAAGGPKSLGDKEMVAIIAYMQRLGRDIMTSSSATAGAP
ncbi:MAG: cbb3-type cytochrome c oxidase subunit II, partial [Gemmatimonadales bacterium]